MHDYSHIDGDRHRQSRETILNCKEIRLINTHSPARDRSKVIQHGQPPLLILFTFQLSPTQLRSRFFLSAFCYFFHAKRTSENFREMFISCVRVAAMAYHIPMDKKSMQMMEI
jgi:hypothetical protein